MKTFRASPAAARHYVEADRVRADDYYLAEETGIADRYVASPGAGVQRLAPLTGDGYEAWVAGVYPDTGQPKGRLRNDAHAVRFVEVTVNGPKSWSLAAELHPDIGAAYDAAQDRAASQIIDWLGRHATTRVGPRGGQVQVPVEQIEAVTVRHRTSRAGDPHRHLHLQINARVLAEGQWRGLHTVGVRDSLDAINGIGHAAVATDPQFRAALSAHGFTVDEGGEIAELKPFLGAFSARAAQISRNIERYESAWRAANPGREPDAQQWRTWDARAWADGRPDKVVARDGAELTRRWVTELHAFGYREQNTAAPIHPRTVGAVDRTNAVEEILTRLAARRSGWNAADIRGEAEHYLARRNVVADAAIRTELAEDLTARTITTCVPLTERVGLPEHIRALTSQHVLDVEADLVGRLAARGAASARPHQAVAASVTKGLSSEQRDAVAALAGDSQLVVVEGAAGAGKTTTLAAARTAIEQRGGRLRVVTPTLKAARVAGDQVGSAASSAAWLAYQHGFRWDEHGQWRRLRAGANDPHTGRVYDGPSDSARLRRGDLLLIDEAGMLDQDTARALLAIADEHGVRAALIGDRHQLPAVGRGGVLDLAVRWTGPESCLTLEQVHRFVRVDTAADGSRATASDDDYARMSLAMRDATDPGAVFDELVFRDRIRVHANDAERLTSLAQTAASAKPGEQTLLVADTRELVAQLNTAARNHSIAAGTVDDSTAVSTNAGQRIGRGDHIVTRRNDAVLGVANRDTWTVVGVARDRSLSIDGALGARTLPAEYVRAHVELGYASTVHGVQGETATTAHTALGTGSSAASIYVAMTRGRESNVAHLVAESLDGARDQWVAAYSRERADLGPAHAADLAEREAARYAQHRLLDQVLADLRAAWTIEAGVSTRLADATHRRDLLRDVVTLTEQRNNTMPALQQRHEQARRTALSADARLRDLERTVTASASAQAAGLQAAWDEQRQPARDAAHTVRHGAGRLGQRRAAVRDAREQLGEWSTAWRPYLPDMPANPEQVVAFADWFDDTPRHHQALADVARKHVEAAHPDYVDARDAAALAHEDKTVAWHDLRDTGQHFDMALQHYGNLGFVDDPAERLAQEEAAIASDTAALATARERINSLIHEPTLRACPSETLDLARADWSADRDRRISWLAAHAATDRGPSAIAPPGRGLGGVLENMPDGHEPAIGR